jgi:hypothetical protein
MAQAPLVVAEAPRAESPPLPVVKLEPKDAAAPAPKVAEKKGPEKKPKVDRLIIVAIDAGHGGEDSGARGRKGTKEKDVTLAIARRLKARIDQEPNMRAGAGARRRLLSCRSPTASRSRGACVPTSSSRSTPTHGSSPMRAARRCSRFRSAAPRPPRRACSRSARTSRTSSAA